MADLIDFSAPSDRRGGDPYTDRCLHCGRFVPKSGRGYYATDYWTGDSELVEGECPKGWGCDADAAD